MIIYGLFILFSCSFSFLHCVFSMKIKKKNGIQNKKKVRNKKRRRQRKFSMFVCVKNKKKK